MPINGSSGWEQGLKPLQRNTMDRAGRTDGNARARMAANAGKDVDPGEPLVCPACRRTQPTGLYCPHCDVELVGESFVDSFQPAPRRKERGWILIAAISTVVLGGLAYAILQTWSG